MATTTDRIVTEFIVRGESALRNSFNRIGSSARGMNGALGGAKQLVGFLGSAAVVAGVTRFAGKALEAADSAEKLEISFRRLTGSQGAAKRTIADIKELATHTGFTADSVLDLSRRFMALGMSSSKVRPTVQAVSDVVSAMGGSESDLAGVGKALERIALQGEVTTTTLTRLRRAGVNIFSVMNAATGQNFTTKQLTAMDGEEFMRNFIKGVEKLYKGSAEEMSNTYSGQLKNIQDTWQDFKEDLGKELLPLAITTLKQFQAGFETVANFIKTHPGITRAALNVASITAVLTASRRVLQSLGATYRFFAGATSAAAMAPGTSVAGRITYGAASAAGGGGFYSNVAANAAAIGGRGGSYAQAYRTALAAAKARPGSVIDPHLEAVRSLRARGIKPSFTNVQDLPYISHRFRMFNGPLLNPFSKPGSAASDVVLRQLGSSSRGSVFGGSSISAGSALVSGAMGLGSGVSAYGNWKAIGNSTGAAIAKSSVTGIATGLGAMFVPGGKVAAMAGEAIAWGINRYINEPLEKAAQEGTDAHLGFFGAAAAFAGGDTHAFGRRGQIEKGNEAAARSRDLFSKLQDRAAQKQEKIRADAEARERAALREDWQNRINNPSNINATQSRNGAWTITIPQSPADQSHRGVTYNANTPTPAYL